MSECGFIPDLKIGEIINFQRSHLPLEENSCELGVGGRIEASEMTLLSLPSPIRVIESMNRPDVVFMGGDDGKIIKVPFESVSNPSPPPSFKWPFLSLGKPRYDLIISLSSHYATIITHSRESKGNPNEKCSWASSFHIFSSSI